MSSDRTKAAFKAMPFLVMGERANDPPSHLVVGAMGLFFYGTGNIATAAVMDASASQVQGSTMSVFRQVFTLPSPIIAGLLVTEFGTKAAFFMRRRCSLRAPQSYQRCGLNGAPRCLRRDAQTYAEKEIGKLVTKTGLH